MYSTQGARRASQYHYFNRKRKRQQREKSPPFTAPSPVGKDISQDNRAEAVDRRNALRTQIPQAEVAARDRNLHARVAHAEDRDTTETSRRNFQNYVIVESFTKRTVNDDGFTPPQKMNDTTAARDLGQQASRSARQHYYNRQRKRQRRDKSPPFTGPSPAEADNRWNALPAQISAAEVAARERNLHARFAQTSDGDATETNKPNVPNYRMVETFKKRAVNDDGSGPQRTSLSRITTTAAQDDPTSSIAPVSGGHLAQEDFRSACQRHYHNRQRRKVAKNVKVGER
ncbi:hypothetical protein FN846DRAFT_901784 [Sphaerosporella brunnea]|uniref:Uncharacterized protein n=1 Tax=Sphaerosporella brunnea TaxID=1250544 RepID=A0A5J5FBQ3_9PEZI|nr:hypothetical protein FN846DRAFT_901784 [Sphaerosporella brunnea]